MADQNQTSLTAEQFYSSLSPDYDTMTGFEARMDRESELFRKIVREHRIGSALDAGAGTGFHTLLLARLGVQVTAADISEEMLRRLQQHASDMHLPVRIVLSGLTGLSDKVNDRFDAVFCLGNTLAHLLTGEDLASSLKNFHALLGDSGSLFIQMLNYSKILRERERIQHIVKRGEKTFIRFYDFSGDRLYFNILTLAESEGKIGHRLQTTELHPYTAGEITASLHASGFSDVKLYSTLSLEPYLEQTSKDLVVIAQ